MSDVLAKIVADKRTEVEQRRTRRPIEELREEVRHAAPPRNFFRALTQPKGRTRVIAEVKKASPSAGLIRPDEHFDPVAIARAFEAGGAAAISCLTDEKYFQGSLAYLTAIRDAVKLPVLRKDFIIDPYQVYEARAAGADAILLIAECLDEALMIDLLILATELRMSTLVEVHGVENLLKVRPHLGFPHPRYTLLGVNNRDLKSMTTDISHTFRMLEMVDDPSIVVSESGIKTREDILKLHDAGVDRVLVGEHLMKQPDVEAALRELIGSTETGT